LVEGSGPSDRGLVAEARRHPEIAEIIPVNTV
jgi:hypothetical protein